MVLPHDENKRTPRRLFSLDSLKSSSSNTRSANDSPLSNEHSSSKLPQVPEGESLNNAEDSTVQASSRPKPINVASAQLASVDAPLASPSRARWQQLRKQLAPATLPTSAVPAPSTPPLTLASSAPAATLPAPPQDVQPSASTRTQIPKSSKLARFGFRQVVEHVRDIADDNRKLALDIQRACYAARFLDLQKSKADNAMGSSLYIPFMQAQGNTPTPQGTNQITSLPSLSTPSLRPLHYTLQQNSQSQPNGATAQSRLPHEYQVLSTLLIPFAAQNSTARLEEERWFAIESFSIVIKTWQVDSRDEATFVGRCLWCINIAMNFSTPLRVKALQMLSELLVGERRIKITKPVSFQTLVQGLLNLLAVSHLRKGEDDKSTGMVKELFDQIRSEGLGSFDNVAIQEEYGALPSPIDDPIEVRKAIMLEALTRCIANSDVAEQQWFMQTLLEGFWVAPTSSTPFSTLQSSIHCRILSLFAHASLRYISVESVPLAVKVSFTQYIIHYLQSRVLPELDLIRDKSTLDARSHIVRLTWNLIALPDGDPVKNWVCDLISQWYRSSSEWRAAFGATLKTYIETGEWPSILSTLFSLLKNLSHDVRPSLAAFIVPELNDHLVQDPPPFPCPALTELLDHISRSHPQIFFKPVFACAASKNDITIANQLCTTVILSKYLPDFWTRDVQMVAIAVLSDTGGATQPAPATPRTPSTPKFSQQFSQPKLGQLVLLVELINRIQALRHAKEARDKESPSQDDGTYFESLRFVVALEVRLGMLLEAREKSAMLPYSYRLLLCILLREMRLFTRSLKPALWLSRVVQWFTTYLGVDNVLEEADDELDESIEQLQALYRTAQEAGRPHKRRTTMLFSPRADLNFENLMATDKGASVALLLQERNVLLESLSKKFLTRVIRLLIATSSLLSPEDHKSLAPQLWYYGLLSADASVAASVCFLFMQGADRHPEDVMALIEVDLRSSDEITRLEAIEKIGILINWRLNILSQPVIADRAHRPFKLTRAPLSFVATDVGSSLYVREEDDDELKDNIPLELRKRLAEIGWTQDESPVDHQSEYIRTPISLLPIYQLEQLEISSDRTLTAPALTNSSSHRGEAQDEPGLLRRNSSTGGPIQSSKRRSIFVPALSPVFPRLARMLFDESPAVASAARSTIIDLMRNDPSLLTRPALELFAGERKDLPYAVTTLRSFLHVHKSLPPSMAHHVFNNITGFLKHNSRHASTREALHDYALTIPILSQLVSQVSGMSLREIRRAKVDNMLIPTGSLWFSHNAPAGPMFPRGIGIAPSDGSLPANLVPILIIRLSQNMLFLAMLKRNHQDVQLVRKNMTRFALPAADTASDPPVLTLKDYVPKKKKEDVKGPTMAENRLNNLSILLSRSYLLLIAQVFRSMSRHLSDRHELGILIDGLNRIMVNHGRDIGIVAQAMIALMVASTRFRRLFISGGGYTLFMPAVIKTYTESEGHSGIRHAIEYAVNRFYALHQKSFMFQTLDVVTHMTMHLPASDADWLARNVYTLFSTLKRGIPPGTPDEAGIHNANKLQEREALILTTAEEKPQTFLASIRRSESQGNSGGGDSVAVSLPEEYETTRLGMEDFVKLFLTVIAHDPTIPRAEHFLRLLRFLTPYLYHASGNTRSVLQEGIDALGTILTKLANKTKPPAEAISSRSVEDTSSLGHGEQASRGSGDAISMCFDFLDLVLAFTRVGGSFASATLVRILEFAKNMVRDSGNSTTSNVISKFFTDLTRNSLIRDQQLTTKSVVSFLRHIAPVLSAYSTTLDLTGVYEIVLKLCAYPQHVSDPTFCSVVMTQMCVPGLAAWEQGTSESVMLNTPYRMNLVALLNCAVLFLNVDIMAEVLKRQPTADYLAGIMIPFALSLNTYKELIVSTIRSDQSHKIMLGRAWVRLLEYTCNACRAGLQQVPEQPKEKRRSTDSRSSRSSPRRYIPTFLLAIQLLKIIIVRAEDDLSLYVPGVWSRLGSLLRNTLAEANADFAFRSTDPTSASPSPTPSPRTSGQFDYGYFSSLALSFRDPEAFTFRSPRVVDYACWSLLAWICTYKTPLMIQLRLYMVERIVALDSKLQQSTAGYGLGGGLGGGGIVGGAGPGINMPPSSPGGRRSSAFVFSKSRRRRSGMPPLSPEASPKASPKVPSFNVPSPHAHDSSGFLAIDGRQAGYQYLNPSSPTRPDGPRPKIVHLGPVSNPSAFSLRRGAGAEPALGAVQLAKSLKIKSLSLVEDTYHRIRLIQACLGYEILLPLPNDPHNDQVNMATYTKHQVLEVLSKETKDLIEECDETHRASDETMVFVEAM